MARLSQSQEFSSRRLVAEVKTEIMASDWDEGSAGALKELFVKRLTEQMTFSSSLTQMPPSHQVILNKSAKLAASQNFTRVVRSL